MASCLLSIVLYILVGISLGQDACHCGISHLENPLIVGGARAEKNYFPWHISIQKYHTHFCSGALISSKFVVTAASCFYNIFGGRYSDDGLMVGVNVTRPLNFEAFATYHDIKRVIIHPHYTPGFYSLDGNIALLELLEELHPFSFMPSCLSRKTHLETGIVSGWGLNGRFGKFLMNLNFVQLEIENGCKSSRKKDQFFCTSDDLRGVCRKDMGSPMVTFVNGSWALVGITTDDRSCATIHHDAFFSNVSYYYQWIKDEAKDQCI